MYACMYVCMYVCVYDCKVIKRVSMLVSHVLLLCVMKRTPSAV